MHFKQELNFEGAVYLRSYMTPRALRVRQTERGVTLSLTLTPRGGEHLFISEITNI